MTDAKRTDTLADSLSALMDGEASELESRRLLRDLDDDSAERWSRWQMARDLMQGHEVCAAPAEFASKLQQAIATESQQSATSTWAARLGRVGIAASVALATVVGWQYLGNPGTSEPVVAQGDARLSQLFAGAELASYSLAPQPAASESARVTASLAEQARLQQLMARHSDFAARQGGSNVPYVRYISLDANLDADSPEASSVDKDSQ